MIREYSKYKVSIKDVKFIAGDGRTFPRTAIISFLNKKGEELRQDLFGILETARIHELIAAGSDLNLDNCYIPDFSLPSYRRHAGIEKKEPVRLVNFSARNAFFESKEATDFSYASFGDGEISFEGSQFGKGKVLFTGSSFGKG